MDFLTIVLTIILIINIFVFFAYLIKRKTEKLWKQKYSKLLSQKKSSEVRLGFVTEQLAPLLEQFKYNPADCQFMGRPIDYIYFGEEEIVFIEVKMGYSQLSEKQRKLKELVENGKVKWETIQVKYKNQMKYESY